MFDRPTDTALSVLKCLYKISVQPSKQSCIQFTQRFRAHGSLPRHERIPVVYLSQWERWSVEGNRVWIHQRHQRRCLRRTCRRDCQCCSTSHDAVDGGAKSIALINSNGVSISASLRLEKTGVWSLRLFRCTGATAPMRKRQMRERAEGSWVCMRARRDNGTERGFCSRWDL